MFQEGFRAGAGEAHSMPASPAPSSAAAQLLATEHWSLLATRGTTWSEVMARISLHLAVSSAALVVLALVAQSSGFGTPFRVMAIGLAAAVLLLGTLTQVRVHLASAEDHALVAGMNRLRAAYRELEPGIEKYFMASWHDDTHGVIATYTLGIPRRTAFHVIGSANFFLCTVNALVAGALGALVAGAAGGSAWVIAVVGAAAGFVDLGCAVEVGRRSFRLLETEVRYPSPP